MNAPTNLGHKPIISINNYEGRDDVVGIGTDARALSIGKAQYGNK